MKNYKEKNRICKRQIKAAKLETERLIAKESKTNPKMFFNYTNGKKYKPQGVGPLQSNEGGVAESDEEKPKLLNIFFSTVFTEENKLSDEMQNIKVNSPLKVPCLIQ